MKRNRKNGYIVNLISLTEYVDTSAVTGKPILTVSARELLATDYYRKSPRSEKQWVKKDANRPVSMSFFQTRDAGSHQ